MVGRCMFLMDAKTIKNPKHFYIYLRKFQKKARLQHQLVLKPCT